MIEKMVWRLSSRLLGSRCAGRVLINRNVEKLILKKSLFTYNLLDRIDYRVQSNKSPIVFRSYCTKSEEVKPELKVEHYKQEIEQLEKQIVELKGQTANRDGKSISIEEGKYDKQSDDEEIVYKMAYDFPGFKLKNIKVTVVERILRIYAYQTSSKKDKDTKEYIYENTTEEILPDEVDVSNMKATFDVENGLLIVQATLPDDCNLKEIQKRTSELNDKLFKLEKELETKKKELSKIKI